MRKMGILLHVLTFISWIGFNFFFNLELHMGGSGGDIGKTSKTSFQNTWLWLNSTQLRFLRKEEFQDPP